MVKGLIKAENLKHGVELTALDGSGLKVSKDGENVKVNGVPVTSIDLLVNVKYVVHKVETALDELAVVEEPPSVTVTVLNSLKWSAENPKGEPEAGVTVALYSSRGDYSAGIALFSGETDVDGKVVFPDTESGATYYIMAGKGDLTNIFFRSSGTINGEFLGLLPDGLFQPQEEVASHAVQNGAAPGNFRWTDLNSDGIINSDDSTPVPYTEAKPVTGETEVIIGYENNSKMIVRDGDDALQKLQASRNLLNNFHKNLVMMDGILSDDAGCESNPALCVLDNYNFLALEVMFLKAWNDGYGNIGQLNLLLRDVPQLAFAEKDLVLGEAKGIRAYIYLQLLTYFGDIPITERLKLESDAIRVGKSEVLEQVESDLAFAVDVLPTGPADGRYILTSDAAKGLLARVALLNQDYAGLASVTDDILQSGRYELMGTLDEVFVDATNSEIIWDFSFDQSVDFTTYFYDRTFCPALRLAEVYLMKAEAELEMANLETGRDYMNIIRSRNSLSPSAEVSLEALRNELRATWQVEMKREGNRFANLVRWQAAGAVLAAKGI